MTRRYREETNLPHYFALVPVILLFTLPRGYNAQMNGVTDLLYNFEAIDPEVLKVFTFQNKKAYGKEADSGEIDIMDVDTSDILNCFSSLSYVCFQKKIIRYIDTLNRAHKINLFGGYMSFVKVGSGSLANAPIITEELLVSKKFADENSLGTILKELFENFIDSHILRITVPVINAKFDARSSRGHCYDFSLGDVDHLSTNNSTRTDLGTNDNAKAPTCYRGDQSMVALSSALVLKMITLLPTLLKVIAAKAVFGILMGVVSVILSKMAILPLVLSYANKNIVSHQPHSHIAPIPGSFRQGAIPPSAPPLILTTDGYETYHPREEQSGTMTNYLERPDYGPTGRSISSWPEGNLVLSKNPVNLHQSGEKFLHASSIPSRKDRDSVNRPSEVLSKTKTTSTSSAYPEMVINGRNFESVTTTGLSSAEIAEKIDIRNNIERSITPMGATNGYLNDNEFPIIERRSII